MKIAILITARLNSTRLPKKVIKPILGRPMIGYMIDRLKLAQKPSRIIICTSPLTQDDPLIEIAQQENIEYFRGHPDDVLLRLTEAASKFEVDTVVSCTADNPFVDPDYIDRLVSFHQENNYDFCKSEGLPFGVFAYTLSYSAMVKACEIKSSTDTEVWGGYFTQTGQFKTGTLQVTDPAVRRPDFRLTVDTPEDFELVTRIFEELRGDERIFPLAEIVALLDSRPDLRAVNAQVKQKAAKPIGLKTRLVADKEE